MTTRKSNTRLHGWRLLSLHFSQICYVCPSTTPCTLSVHQINLEVNNGLGVFTWHEDIIVSYRDAPPRFVVNRYIATVEETAAVGFPVQTVEALVDGRNASLIYVFTGNVSDLCLNR